MHKKVKTKRERGENDTYREGNKKTTNRKIVADTDRARDR
jgi:hypothetical protein